MKRGIIWMVALLVGQTALYAANRMAEGNKPGISITASGDGDNTSEAVPVWEFYFVPQRFSAQELETASNNRLGREVACLYQAFESIYVVKEEVVPGDPMRRTVIRKPDIYNAVRKIERLITQQIKKEGLAQEKGATEFARVLNVALAAVDTECGSFEKSLMENRKDTERLRKIFRSVSLKAL